MNSAVPFDMKRSLVAGGTSAAAAGGTAGATAGSASAAAEALATADDGDDGRRGAGGYGDNLIADRAGECGNERIAAVPQLLNAVLSRFQTADDQRFIQLQTAARA